MSENITPIKKAKQRAAEVQEKQSSVSADQESAIRQLANDLHRLNHSVMRAVDAGVSVELVRSARHHGDGNWGDLMVPVIVKGWRLYRDFPFTCEENPVACLCNGFFCVSNPPKVCAVTRKEAGLRKL